MQPPGFHTRRPRSSQIRLGGSLASCVARVANVHVVQRRARRQARRVCRDVCTLSALTGELNLIVRLCAPCPWVSDRVCVSRLPPVMPGVFGARGGAGGGEEQRLVSVSSAGAGGWRPRIGEDGMVLESGPTIRHRHRIVGAPRSRGHSRRASGEADRWIDGFFLTEPRDTNSHLWRLSCAPCVSPRAARSCPCWLALLGFGFEVDLVVETLLEILPAVVCRGLRADTGAPRSESDVSP